MKRLIAVLLTVLMVASLCTVFSAAEETAEDVNLIAGKENPVTGYDKYNGSLTDGVAGNELTYGKDEWFGLYYNTDANGNPAAGTNSPNKVGTLVYDLGETCTVSKVRIHTALCNASGIQSPKSVVVSVSEDGETYKNFSAKTFTVPEANDTTVAWVEYTGTAIAGRYVKITVELNSVFAFMDEIEVLGHKGDTTNAPIAHEVTLDGKLDEAVWAKAPVVNTAIWQNYAENDPQPALNASYKVTADDENIYLAVTVDDAWNYKDDTYQTGATNFRIWVLGDADYADESTRTFFDVTLKEDKTFALWYNTGATVRKEDGTGKISVGADTSAETVSAEFAIKKSAVNAINGFKMMVSYSSPAIAEEGKEAKYNAYHITPGTYTEEGKLPNGWAASAVLYQEFVYANGTLRKAGDIVVNVDGKLDETVWATAPTVNTGLWQGIADTDPQPAITASYKVAADDENFYVAVTVDKGWDFVSDTYQTGSTFMRIWVLGDGDYENEGNRQFFDIQYLEDGSLKCYLAKTETDKITAAADTTAETITAEFAFKKADINSNGGLKMMVTYSSPSVTEEGKDAKYNAYHMTTFVRGEDGKLADKWSANASMYQEFIYADGVLTKPTTEEPVTPPTGDAGVVALVVLALVAVFGSAVVVKSRR